MQMSVGWLVGLHYVISRLMKLLEQIEVNKYRQIDLSAVTDPLLIIDLSIID